MPVNRAFRNVLRFVGRQRVRRSSRIIKFDWMSELPAATSRKYKCDCKEGSSPYFLKSPVAAIVKEGTFSGKNPEGHSGFLLIRSF
jgi:hypothetical protein